MTSTIRPWPFDTGLDPEFPFYTRGNAGEVLPDVLSPLMCTLGQPLIERAMRRVFSEVIPVVGPGGHPATFSAIVGGRSYLNLSVARRHADLSPGVSAEAFDHQFAASGVQLPPYERPDEADYEERGGRVESSITALLEEPPLAEIESDRAAAWRRRDEGRAGRSRRSATELLERCDDLAPEFVDAFVRHVVVSTLSSVTFGALSKGLAGVYGPDSGDMTRRLLSGLGETVDSAAPGHEVAELARLEGDDYRAALRRFLDRHGYRGANEWEIAAPPWELVPDAVDQMVDAARKAPPKPDATALAAAARDRMAADGVDRRWPELAFWLPKAELYVANRERTKATAVLLFNELRLDLFELGRRLAAEGDLGHATDVGRLTIDEVGVAAATGSVRSGVVEARAAHMAELRGLVPPLVVEAGAVPPLGDWRRAGAAAPMQARELRGVAGAPGRAVGRVRVVRDPYTDAPPRPGEVLVAPITDPGWTLLFVAAEAVVVEVGGELSHAVIVARELGIPAVVSVTGCCDELRTGDLIEVDGSAGVVRVLERGEDEDGSTDRSLGSPP